MYKLKIVNGRVNCLLRTGNDFVKDSMPVSAAQKIIDEGNMINSTIPHYPICINDEWFFEGTGDKTVKKHNGKVEK